MGTLALCTMAAIAWLGAVAPADGTDVAVTSVVFEEVDPVAQARIEEAWQTGLEQTGARVTRSGTDSCADEGCLAQLVDDETSGYAAGLRVAQNGRDYTIRITLVDAAGRATVVEAECAICGFDEVAQLVQDKSRDLAPKLAAEVPGTLSIESDPPGARIVVDGEAVGRTPDTLELPEGEHEVRLELSGHFPVEQTVVVVGGSRESRTFELDSSAPARDRPKWIAGWTLVGAGVGTLVGASVFWAYHHRDVRGRCDDAVNLDVNGTCRYRYNALGPAVGLTVVGLAAVGTGVALVLLGRRKRTEQVARRVRPLVGPGSLAVQIDF